MSETDPAVAPGWLRPLVEACRRLGRSDLTRVDPPAAGQGRHSAVLMLLSGPSAAASADGPDRPSARNGRPNPDRSNGSEGVEVLLLQRAAGMRNHPGQVAFPGGATDPGDASSSATALREAEEEVGLRPDSVQVQVELPDLFLPPSGFVVTPVLAFWRLPHPVGVVDAVEVARVEVVSIAELTDPANRFTVSHPSGRVGPGFWVRELFVWGFTGGLLDQLIRSAGWERPWDVNVVRPVPGL
ncbi:MAG: hydrolase [Frankiales bacterium]|nr:hydrolase [Frankiales bacterium]